jgi:hypothetical protein
MGIISRHLLEVPRNTNKLKITGDPVKIRTQYECMALLAAVVDSPG